jgi:hypothetical protein
MPRHEDVIGVMTCRKLGTPPSALINHAITGNDASSADIRSNCPSASDAEDVVLRHVLGTDDTADAG